MSSLTILYMGSSTADTQGQKVSLTFRLMTMTQDSESIPVMAGDGCIHIHQC